MDEQVLREMLRINPSMIRRLIEEMAIGTKEAMGLAINWIDRSKDRFWCPGCEKMQSHPEAVSPWINPEGKLVCFYLVCRRCTKSGVDAFRAGDRSLSQHKVDLIERVLVSHYPHIAENLPPNYFETSSEQELPGNLMIPSPVKLSVNGERPQVAYRKYLVIRFFHISALDTIDKQCAVVWHLGERYPLVTVCSNGEEPEGLEAWFKVEGWTEEGCRAFMEYACTLGADPKTFDPQCLVHLPGATNPETGKLQRVLYLDPEGKNFPDGPTLLRQQRPPKP